MNSERWINSHHKKHHVAKLLSAILSIVLLTLPARAEENFARIYHYHPNKEKKIALTFDDGPHPILTLEILEILRKYHVKATFFVVGENAENYPDTLEQIVREGHELGNHTYTHNHIGCAEIESCERAIYELTDCQTKLFRPPEGFVNQSIMRTAADLGYDIILWDIDTKDWAHTAPTQIGQMILEKVRAGSIILMHDYISYSSPTPAALELFIPKVQALGYQFVVVSELIGTQ